MKGDNSGTTSLKGWIMTDWLRRRNMMVRKVKEELDDQEWDEMFVSCGKVS